MLNCNITFDGKEYTVDEFKEFVLENGMGVLAKNQAPNRLATAIINKYDVDRLEESVSELWARLELEKDMDAYGYEEMPTITKQVVDRVLQPGGQLTNYSTQEEIRYNTYSGMAITGIAANFGKVLAYLFGTTPITAIRDRQSGEIITNTSVKFKALQAEYNSSTFEGILQKNPRYTVHTREEVKLLPKFHFTVDGKLVSGFSMTSFGKFSKNVFETVDTVINLAIDNVKMQKLHLLGITNANANTFLAMIGMGVPLNTVSRIFKSPGLKEISEGSRWTAEKLNKELLPLITELGDYFQDLPTVLSRYMKADKIAEFMSELSSKKNASSALARLPIITRELENVYTGRASELQTLLQKAALLSLAKKLLPVGEELFAQAQVYSTLRKLPNKKAKVDAIVGNIQKYYELSNEAAKQDQNKILFDVLAQNYRSSEEYKAIEESNGVEAAEQSLEDSVKRFMSEKDYINTLRETISAGITNRVLRRTNSRVTNPTANSAFENVSVLRLPHVLAAYRVLLQHKNLLEQTFFIYNPAVTAFVRNLMIEANMFTDFEYLEKVDVISKELLKFVTADLAFELQGMPFNLSVSDELTYFTAGRTLFAKDAWKQIFINKLIQAQEKFDENELLSALEVTTKDGVSTIRLLSDKTSDEELLEKMRADFENLYESDDEVSPGYTLADLAVDLFKYSLISDGMFYEKTGLSLIFPATWAINYSTAMEERLEAVMPRNNPITDVNLHILKDKFIRQLVRVRPDLVRRLSRPESTRTAKMSWGPRKVYHGTEIVNGQTIHFDLKFSLENPPKYARLYDKSIYILMAAEGGTAYYRLLTKEGGTAHYQFDVAAINESLDTELIRTYPNRLINRSELQSSVYVVKPDGYELEVGQTIGALNMQDASADAIREYTVTAKRTGAADTRYTLRYEREINLSKETASAKIREEYSKYVDIPTATLVVSDNLTKYRKQSVKAGHIIYSKTDGNVDLPIYAFNESTSAEQLEEMVADTIEMIRMVPKSAHYYIDPQLLNGIPLKSRAKIAQALFDKTGFRDLTLNTESLLDSNKLILKRIESDIKTVPPYHILTLDSETNQHTLPRKGILSSVVEGETLYLGSNNYLFVTHVNDSQISGLVYPSEVFAALPDRNVSFEEFLTLYNKLMNC